MEPRSELETYLANYQSEGTDEGEGDFTLDPLRALEILTEQGSVASHAPLFLFRALYQHTAGATLIWRQALLGHYLLSWPDRFGSPPREAMRIMAEGAFKANGIDLKFGPAQVVIRSRDSMKFPVYTAFEKTFLLAEPRLRHYPVEGLFHPLQRSGVWQRREYPEGKMELRFTKMEPQAAHFVVHGIEFSEPTFVPLNVTVFDDGLKCDLSLTRIPDTERKRQWISRARSVLTDELGKVFSEQERVRLDFDHLSNQLRAALEHLPYLVSLNPDDALRQQVLGCVMFRDVFGKYWSLESLFESQSEYGSIYTLDSIPRHCPDEPSGERPVLHWRGDTRIFGEPLFNKTRSGAGYIYSLALGGSPSDDASALEIVDWEGGHLSLLPLGPAESRCEIQLVGKRRGSENIYLDEPAPRGLRLVWRSRDELASWNPSAEFMAQVVAVVDRAIPGLEVSADWIRGLLTWTGVDDLEDCTNLLNYNFFETVAGFSVSPKFLESTFPDRTVPVLEERSASLPKKLPFDYLLWAHPLLEQLGFNLREESSTVRKAYWREDGRERWMSKHQRESLQEWADCEGLTLEKKEGHFLASTSSQTLSKLIVWREGRPLGQVFLSEDQFPRGYVLIYVDDNFPADQYWSGPDREAMSRLGPWIDKMKP